MTTSNQQRQLRPLQRPQQQPHYTHITTSKKAQQQLAQRK